ncbi:glycosyltransferase family 2 protein [Gloeobacter kilaueensis]|uniref:Glycosyl transferase family 2 n=1 Tax=Gloeobacter kilaueensis (strain ATCC BAA-2537 / CCAP 1431/1 / ULC 316 / JS1) TaxID=1183438 RepID=U5QLR8_GLOK1|nr:glycosyltransferase family 2 protein [Gloeobacter kilaueensis]AGY58635.1 hypothetical protein GKIL_2389 [Gloeobacter kilaueensis JS1]
MERPTVICLTPVRNEGWILERFLTCASLWADYILLLDQLSSDETAQIARRHSKVTLLTNPSTTYDEAERQRRLIEAARCIPGRRLLITLDADEMLTANFMTSPEWRSVLAAPPGSIIGFQWVNILPDLQRYWTSPYDYYWGFMDDGSDHGGSTIHSPRIPLPPRAPRLTLREVKVMHYQFTDWERLESKTRWYQCWERINQPERRAVEVYRQYHHMYAVAPERIQPIPGDWLTGYRERGIDMTSVLRDRHPWWDKEVLDLFEKFGTAHFRRQNIWQVDWQAVYRELHEQEPPVALGDPRSRIEKLIHRWLAKTQADKSKFPIRTFDRLLGLLGW